MMFQKFSDKYLIESILEGGRRQQDAWLFISTNWAPYCCSVAQHKTGCDDQEIRMAFSVACTGLNSRIKNSGDVIFLKSATLKSYLTVATIRAAWAVKKSQRPSTWNDLEIIQPIEIEPNIEQSIQKAECQNLLEKVLSTLGERCKKILLLFNDGYVMNDIMREMKFASEAVAKTEKWQCQEKFKTYLKTHPDVKSLLIENCYG